MSVSIKNSVSGGGGGITSDEVTATASDVLKGKTYVGNDTNDEIGTGTLELTGNASVENVLRGNTFYSTNAKSKQTGTLELTGNAAVGDVLKNATFYNTNAKSKKTGTLELTGNAAVGDVLKNATFYNTNAKSKQTGTLELTGNAGIYGVLEGLTFYSNNAKNKQMGYAILTLLSSSPTAAANKTINVTAAFFLIVSSGTLTINRTTGVEEVFKLTDTSTNVKFAIYRRINSTSNIVITTNAAYAAFGVGTNVVLSKS